MAVTVKELLVKHGVETNDNLVSDLKSILTGIPASRLTEVTTERNALRADIADAQSTIQGFSTLNEQLASVTSQRDDYMGKWNGHQNSITTKNLESWKSKSSIFDAKKGDAQYDKIQKVKGKFAFGDDLTSEQITSNLNSYAIYDDIGYFGEATKVPGESVPPPKAETSKKGKFGGYDTYLEWVQHDYRAAAKWKKKH